VAASALAAAVLFPSTWRPHFPSHCISKMRLSSWS